MLPDNLHFAGPRKKMATSTKIVPQPGAKPTPSPVSFRSPKKQNQRLVEKSSDPKPNFQIIHTVEDPDSESDCTTCSSPFYTPSYMANHKKNMHEKFACLHCSRIFKGEKALRNHVEVSVQLDNGDTPNTECVPTLMKVVHVMCPNCPFISIGNTYRNYMEVANHNRLAHPEKVNQRNDEIEVEVDGGKRRKLATFEISRLKFEANRAQESPPRLNNVSIADPRKRRNVAVKSTARIPPSATRGEPPNKIVVLQSSSTHTIVTATQHRWWYFDRPPSVGKKCGALKKLIFEDLSCIIHKISKVFFFKFES